MDDDPRDDIVRVDRPDAQGELELLVDLLGHRALSVRRRERTLRDIGRLVGIYEPFILQDAPDPLAHRVALRLGFFWVRESLRGLVEGRRVRRHNVEVVGLLADFVRVDARGEDKRRVHEPSAFVREEGPREVDQAAPDMMWVKGRCLMAFRVVPSLDAAASAVARRTPVSIGSGVFVLELILWTDLMTAGFDSPVRSSAVRRTSASGISCRVGAVRD